MNKEENKKKMINKISIIYKPKETKKGKIIIMISNILIINKEYKLFLVQISILIKYILL